jgi:hypothetical protein
MSGDCTRADVGGGWGAIPLMGTNSLLRVLATNPPTIHMYTRII